MATGFAPGIAILVGQRTSGRAPRARPAARRSQPRPSPLRRGRASVPTRHVERRVVVDRRRPRTSGSSRASRGPRESTRRGSSRCGPATPHSITRRSGSLERQGTKQRGVHEAEHHRARADPERERQDHRERKPGPLDQRTNGDAEVVEHARRRSTADASCGTARIFRRLRESEPRRRPGANRRVPAAGLGSGAARVTSGRERAAAVAAPQRATPTAPPVARPFGVR